MSTSTQPNNNIHQQRAEYVFKDFVDSQKQRLSELEQGHSEISGLIQDLKSKVFKHIQKQCYESFHWIELHGTIFFTDRGVNVNIKENFTKEADIKLQEFSECAQKNDFDIKNYFEKKSAEQAHIEALNENCVSDCVSKPEDKSDDDLKLCVNQCYDDAFKDMKKFYSSVKSKIKEFENKMI